VDTIELFIEVKSDVKSDLARNVLRVVRAVRVLVPIATSFSFVVAPALAVVQAPVIDSAMASLPPV
jgi:hypothetical protein